MDVKMKDILTGLKVIFSRVRQIEERKEIKSRVDITSGLHLLSLVFQTSETDQISDPNVTMKEILDGLKIMKSRVKQIEERKEIKNNMEIAADIKQLLFIITGLENTATESRKRNRVNEDDFDVFFVRTETDSKLKENDISYSKMPDISVEPMGTVDTFDFKIDRADEHKLSVQPSDIEACTPQLKYPTVLIERVPTSDMLDFKVDRADKHKLPGDEPVDIEADTPLLRNPTVVIDRVATSDMFDFKIDRADVDKLTIVNNCEPINSNEENFDCDVCNKQLSDKNTLRNHQNNRHGGYHKCKACGSRCTSNAKLLKNICEGNSQSTAPDINLDFAKYTRKITTKYKDQTLYKCIACPGKLLVQAFNI